MRWAVLAVALVTVGCGKKVEQTSEPKADSTRPEPIGGDPSPPTPKVEAKDVAIGQEVDCGNLQVAVYDVFIMSFDSEGTAGTIEHRPELVARLKIRNKTAGLVDHAKSQVEHARLYDDKGNELRPPETVDSAGRRTTVKGQIPAGTERAVNSDKTQGDTLVFAKPLASASKVTLEINTASYGKPGRIRITVPRERFDPAKQKK